MTRALIVGLLLAPVATSAGAQAQSRVPKSVVTPAPSPPPGSTVLAPLQPPPAQAQTVAVPPAASDPAAVVPSDVATALKTHYQGQVPPVALTIAYPPGRGDKFTLETHGLAKGDDGYYVPTSEANSFVMKIPHPARDSPVTVSCSVRGRPRAVGTLTWLYSNGGPGGGVDFRFPAGETESRYQTNFGPNAYANTFPITTLWITLPTETAVKECRVSSTFEWESQKLE